MSMQYYAKVFDGMLRTIGHAGMCFGVLSWQDVLGTKMFLVQICSKTCEVPRNANVFQSRLRRAMSVEEC